MKRAHATKRTRGRPASREASTGFPVDGDLRSLATLRSSLILLSLGVTAVGCASQESNPVSCLVTDEECIENARLRGEDVLLVDAEGNLVDQTGRAVEDSSGATIPAADPFWRLQAGDSLVEGRIGLVGRREGRLTVQLVSREATNLLLLLPEQGGQERNVEEALLVHGRGPTCALVHSEPPFQVQLTSNGGPWVAGRFAGTLACPDFVALPVSGVFRVREGERP